MIPDYEQRLDDLFDEAFDTNHPAMHDWVSAKMELRKLRINQLKEDNDAKLTGIEKLDELATKIINHYSDELKGLKRYNSLTVLAQKFRLLESECTRRIFSNIQGRGCSEVIVDETTEPNKGDAGTSQ